MTNSVTNAKEDIKIDVVYGYVKLCREIRDVAPNAWETWSWAEYYSRDHVLERVTEKTRLSRMWLE